MYQAKHAQTTAVNMYLMRQPHAAVVKMIVAEGGPPEQADELAREYFADYLFLCTTANQRTQRKAARYRTIGFASVLGGFVLACLTYLASEDGKESLFFNYLLIAFRFLAIGKSLLDERQVEATLLQLQQQERALKT